MKYEELQRIDKIVALIEATKAHQAYQKAYKQLLDDQQALSLLAGYHAAQQTFAATVVSQSEHASMKAEQKEYLLAQKAKVNANQHIKNYFVMSRTIEFFIDNLNYEINQALGKKRKSHCQTKRNAK